MSSPKRAAKIVAKAIVAKNVPQKERPGFHEFLRLKRRAIDMMAVRNRTGRNEVMRHSRNWVV